MPEGVVEKIRANENEIGLICLGTIQRFNKGDAVQVTAGAMCDQVGIFDYTDDNERVIILLHILGREVKTRLPAEAVTAAA